VGAANLVEAGGYTLVNLRLARRWSAGGRSWIRGGEVWLAVENMLDRTYSHRPGYPMPGFSPSIGVKLGW
jgi:iron complex outermembrane receptor protein